MRTLRWMCGVPKKDNVRNEHVRGSIKVAPVIKNTTEKRPRHVKRREEVHVLRRMLDAPVQERDGEEDSKSGGKTRLKEIWKVWG